LDLSSLEEEYEEMRGKLLLNETKLSAENIELKIREEALKLKTDRLLSNISSLKEELTIKDHLISELQQKLSIELREREEEDKLQDKEEIEKGTIEEECNELKVRWRSART
jgi:uncharacterized protein YlxP (DUF503 family)